MDVFDRADGAKLEPNWPAEAGHCIEAIDSLTTIPMKGTDTPLERRRYRVISMFSGCGGMDLGFTGGFRFLGTHYERLPFEIIWANDANEAACRTYKRNLKHEIILGDVWEAMETMPTSADVVIGGFPCQDISINGKRGGVGAKRSGLYRAMVEAVRILKPRIFVAENVKGLLLNYNRSSLEQVLSDFGALGYTMRYPLYNAADYGVPQIRERVFLVGTSPDAARFIPPIPTTPRGRWISAKQAIEDLETVDEAAIPNHIWSRANKSAEQGNRRLHAGRPSHTIRAECHGNIQFHYRLERRISMREAARFQSFPDDFVFDAKLRETERQIGNAVPPVLAWHIARAVARSLSAHTNAHAHRSDEVRKATEMASSL